MAFRPPQTSWDTVRTDEGVSEREKGELPYLIANIDDLISSLVKPNPVWKIARRYYEGVYDPQEFEYLTGNAGIGNPAELRFIPLIRTTIEALKGQLLDRPNTWQARATDEQSVSFLESERLDELIADIAHEATEHLQRQLESMGTASGQASPNSNDPMAATMQQVAQQRWQSVMDSIQQKMANFQGSHERQAASLLRTMLERFNLLPKLAEFMEHCAVEGILHFRVHSPGKGRLPIPEIVPPGELFFPMEEKGELRKRSAVVRWQRLTRQEVLNRWGHLMTDTERETVQRGTGANGVEWIPLVQGQEKFFDELLENDEKLPLRRRATKSGRSSEDLIDTYHVEWLANNRVDLRKNPEQLDTEETPEGARLSRPVDELDHNPTGTIVELSNEQLSGDTEDVRYRLDRYEGVALGAVGAGRIYLGAGRSKHVDRSIDNPWECTLSYDGEHYGHSLVYATKDLQDSYNITGYLEESLTANSGVPGSYINMPDIPSWMGVGEEGLKVWLAYKKQGAGILDTSEEGSAGGMSGRGKFNNYGEFGAGIDGSILTALQAKSTNIEEKASRITGVPRQMLAAISQQDLVGTTEQAIVQSTVVTKPMMTTVGTVIGRFFTAMLNGARWAYEGVNSVVSQTLLGQDGMREFSFDARRFALADWMVTVTDSKQDFDLLQQLKSAGIELIKAQLIKPEHAVELMLLRDLGTARHQFRQAVQAGNRKDVEQLQAQMQQLSQQFQEATKERDQLQKTVQSLNGREQMRKEMETQGKLANERTRDANTARHNDEMTELERDRVELEANQVVFNANSMEVKDQD